jgi:hypothetical protein
MSEVGCLRDGHFQNLEVTGASGLLVNGVTTTEIDGDMAARTTIKKHMLVNDNVVKYNIVLDLSSGIETPSATDGDIIGLAAAASTVVNLPADFNLVSGSMRNKTATGATFVVNLVMSSQDNSVEDAAVTDEFTLINALNGNSATGTFTSFTSVDSSGKRRYMYLTNSGTGNATALTAGVFEINLIGHVNKGSLPAVPSYGGRVMAIGYTDTAFATAADGEAGNFMLSPGTAVSTVGALIIPKNAFILHVFVKSTVTLTTGGAPTYIIGLNTTSATEATGTDILFTNPSLANVNTGFFVLGGVQTTNAGTLVTPLLAAVGQSIATTPAGADAIETKTTTAKTYVTYGVNIAANTAGEAKIMIEYIVV